MIIWLTIALATIAIIIFIYMRQSKFGKNPSGQRLELIKKSPNYKNGTFQNLNFTPEYTEGYSMLKVAREQYFKKAPNRVPLDSLPTVRTDLLNLPIEQDVLVWFGHSSYYIQIDGKRILIDPVFSGNASPIPGTMKAFKGTDIYTVEDFSNIDYLFITHDHYDHIDYETILKLKTKTNTVICGLGVGEHFEYWGYNPSKIIERDWNGSVQLDKGFTAFVLPARHFSGRGLVKNKTLWCSYLLQTPTMKIYIGGDSGYDTHFAEIGHKFDNIDLAILDNGQYNVAWRYIHMSPDEVLKAAQDLKAKRLFPVHNSKFVLSNHSWYEPLNKITELNKKGNNIPLVTPKIGEAVYLKNTEQEFKDWWTNEK